MASGQQGTGSYHMGALQRPGIHPHAVNERNRSNSEGIIQASVAARNKRMGVITRKNTDLGTLDETRAYRNSPLARSQPWLCSTSTTGSPYSRSH